MAWILGSYLGGIIGTLGVLVVAHLQHKEQKILKQQLQAEKAENDRFLEMDKLRKEIDFANLYLEKFISYYDEYGNLYEKAINKLDRLLFIKDEKHYLIENDFIQVSATAYELEKDYNQLMNTYNLLKL